MERMALRIQCGMRGRKGRKKAITRREFAELEMRQELAAMKLTNVVRGKLARSNVKAMKLQIERERELGGAARYIQKCYRGHTATVFVQHKREERAARFVQRVYRGHCGREIGRQAYERLELLRRQAESATKLQATWRMKTGREEYRIRRVFELASTEVQRIFRGYLGRRRATRLQEWENAEPGAERLALGLKLVEDSKLAFERQQEEIDALHRAQEQAETRVSQIHEGLRDSERELAVLERELQEIDQIEQDLHELTHETEMLHANSQAIMGARGDGAVATFAGSVNGDLRPIPQAESKEDARRRQAESYALEMAIHLKRAEREKKKKELETEFAAVFAEVQSKKDALSKLEVAISDMESTRMRKDREFQRLQRNLMELLEEQKFELDQLREKGIELETATATSAAAATATALRVKEHEQRSNAMFQSTEELMKFQFMSMSLSYFSSLNMLKNLRDINAETTTTAIASSAETAAAAASAAAAANIPSLKHMKIGAEEFLDASQKKKKQQLREKERQAAEARKALEEPFPDQISQWSGGDVCRWLDTLALGQYKQAFQEAAVDGEFLIELRPDDMTDVLGIEHQLHVRKVCSSFFHLRV